MRLSQEWRQGNQTYLYIFGDHTLLVIELKATPNGNPSDDCYWRQKSSSLNVVQYNTTVGLLFFTYKSI